MLVGIGDAAVVLFFELVLFRIGRGIAAQPELLDELVALFVVGELGEGGALFIGDDVAHVLVEPFLVGLADLLLQRLFVGAALLFGKRLGERIHFRLSFFLALGGLRLAVIGS